MEIPCPTPRTNNAREGRPGEARRDLERVELDDRPPQSRCPSIQRCEHALESGRNQGRQNDSAPGQLLRLPDRERNRPRPWKVPDGDAVPPRNRARENPGI